MGGEWRETTLDQIGRIVTGKTPPSSRPDYFGGDIPFVTPTDFDGRRIIDRTGRYLTENGANSVAARIPARAVMVSCIGSDMGKAAVSGRESVTNQQINSIIVADPNNPLFVYYNLSTRKEEIRGAAGGSAQPILNKSAFGRLAILLPPPAEQRAIAHILGTLDDKIELNRKQNETLEAMARALFKAWFVDFEPVRAKIEGRARQDGARSGQPRTPQASDLPWPGAEAGAGAEGWQRGQSLPGLPAHLYDLFPDRLVESELGEIPEGWEISTVGEHMVNFAAKRIPLSGAERAKRQGPYPYHGAAGVVDYVNDYLFDGIYLLVGEDGSVVQESGLAVTQYVWGKMWVNNHAHVLQGKGTVSTEQLYLHFQFEPVAAYVTGAVQPKLSQGRMNKMPFVFAGEHVCRAFAELVRPWFAKRRSSSDANKTLAALRDTLLPKLISGELRVPDAEAFLKERGL
jgi:type I restriction enzyme S subunit